VRRALSGRETLASIEKARDLLGYEPRYTSLEATREAVDALVEAGKVETE
jgi:nucleoside-diphosphate-sugar epimerase